jgi:hypothetical protein
MLFSTADQYFYLWAMKNDQTNDPALNIASPTRLLLQYPKLIKKQPWTCSPLHIFLLHAAQPHALETGSQPRNPCRLLSWLS